MRDQNANWEWKATTLSFYSWWDTNKDGHLDAVERDRWQLDNAEYPGMFEHASDSYYDNASDMLAMRYVMTDGTWEDDEEDDYVDRTHHRDSSEKKRNARSSSDYSYDELDDYDEEEDGDDLADLWDDEYSDDYRPSYADLKIERVNASDLAAGRKLAEHLKAKNAAGSAEASTSPQTAVGTSGTPAIPQIAPITDAAPKAPGPPPPGFIPKSGAAPAPQEEKPYVTHVASDDSLCAQGCLGCAFWHGKKSNTPRVFGCAVFYAVMIEEGGRIPDSVPSEDGKICGRYQKGKPPHYLTCLDCKHWEGTTPFGKRSEKCTIWSKVCTAESELRTTAHRKFGANVDFTGTPADSPSTSDDICVLFGLRDNWQPQRPHEFKKYRVAGLAYEGRMEHWRKIRTEEDLDIQMVPEPDNPYDVNAIAVYALGAHAGYLRAHDAEEMAAHLHAGGEVEVLGARFKSYESKGESKLSVTLEAKLIGGHLDDAEKERIRQRAGGKGSYTAQDASEGMADDVYPVTQEVMATLDLPEWEILPALRKLKR